MAALIAALTLTFAACGGDDDSADPGGDTDQGGAGGGPACTELYAAGRPTADVVAEANDPSGVCTDGGQTYMTPLVSFPCTGDPTRTVHYTSAGHAWSSWGIDGETWQLMPAGQDAPPADAC